MTVLSLDGIVVSTPPGWDARLYRRTSRAAEPTFPVAHGATCELPESRGDYGSGVVERLGPEDVFVALLEFRPADASSALFARAGLPDNLDPAAFSPTSLQRGLPGQAGLQVFFHQSGRAFCLYVVLGSGADRARLVPKATDFVCGIRISGSTGGPA